MVNIRRTISQVVEKVLVGKNLEFEKVFSTKKKRILSLCLIDLFRFCPAAIITPSMFTLSKRLKRKRLKR